MKNFSKFLTISLVLFFTFSCSKYQVKTPYRIEVNSTGETLDGMQWGYKSSGVQGTNEGYQGTSSTFVKEFMGTSRCHTTFVANCYDAELNPCPVTIRIYRKKKLVKEGSGSGKLTVDYNTL